MLFAVHQQTNCHGTKFVLLTKASLKLGVETLPSPLLKFASRVKALEKTNKQKTTTMLTTLIFLLPVYPHFEAASERSLRDTDLLSAPWVLDVS